MNRVSVGTITILVCVLFASVTAEFALLRAEGSSEPVCIGYNPKFGALPTTPQQFQDIAYTVPSDACDIIQNDLSGKAALAYRGGCEFYLKAKHSKQAGATLFIVVNNGTEFFTPGGNSTTYSLANIPVAMIASNTASMLTNTSRIQVYAPTISNLDGNQLVMWFIAVGTVCLAAWWTARDESTVTHGYERASNKSGEDGDDESLHISWRAVIIFVLIACGMLAVMYYFFQYMVYVVIALFYLGATTALYSCLKPTTTFLGECGAMNVPYLGAVTVRCAVLAALCLALGTWWVVERNSGYAWVLQDILGIAFIINVIRRVKLPNLKTATLLLCMFFVYDIFFVFVTPLLTSSGESVMVKVATGGGTSSEQMPIVLRLPRFTDPYRACDTAYAVLGFGDLVVPGMLVAFAAVVDAHTRTHRRMCGLQNVYFLTTAIGYAIGMTITYVVLIAANAAQPALLYLVPCTLGPIVAMARYRGELSFVWHGSEKADGNPTVSNSRLFDE
eukprot:Colp12_sorted_trinity150504_noHs@13787